MTDKIQLSILSVFTQNWSKVVMKSLLVSDGPVKAVKTRFTAASNSN